MLGSLNQSIRRPINLWLNINSLSTTHSKDKGPQTKGKITKCNMDKMSNSLLLKKIWVPQTKFKRSEINNIEPLLLSIILLLVARFNW